MAPIETMHPSSRGPWRALALVLLVLLVTTVAGLSPVAVGAAPHDTDGDGLQDRFEQAYGLDPTRRDTDGDGLRDPAEDEDGDRLGARGEQSAGTSPLLADTDEDGRSDGREDADGDGVDNAHQQDRRGRPRRLDPPLATVSQSRPQAYGDGCHSAPHERTVHPCAYGDATSARTVVLFGDSHAVQWLPALHRGGVARGWRVVNLSKSACPAAAIAAPRWNVDESCDDWRQAAFRWIAEHPPALVVMSSSLVYQRRGPDGRLQDRRTSRDEWIRAVRSAVERVPRGVAVLVVADTPRMLQVIPRCLALHPDDLSRCSMARSRATSPETAAGEQAAVEAAGGRFVSLNPLVCPYDPCPALNGDIIIWRDHAHITRRMAELLWRPVAEVVAAALEPRGPGAKPARGGGSVVTTILVEGVA